MQRIFNNKLWLAAPLALFMTGCWLDSSSHNNSGGDGGVTPNSTVPVVISTTPVDLATGVATTGNITATFSEAMDPATITSATFILMKGTADVPGENVPGEVTYTGTVATFNPIMDLAANTVLTATINTGAKDLAGDALAVNKTWSFTTGTVPTVSSTMPADVAVDVATNKNITATFSEAMDPATINATTFTLTFMEGVIVTQVPGEVTYTGTVATFNPTLDLAANTVFTATITTAAKDLAGDALAANKTWSFTTGAMVDDTVPTVSSTLPANLANQVAINRNITATFSEAMDPATINATTFTLLVGTTDVPGVNVPGVVTYDGTIATLNPTIDLAANTVLTATITTGAKDLAGNALAANKTWSFTTGATVDDIAPTVNTTTPADLAIGVHANGNITATFSEAMDPATINVTTFTLMVGTTNVPGENIPGEVTYLDNVATFNPTNNLAGNTVFTATITTGAKDLAGNALAANKIWSFTTAAGQAAVNLRKAGTFAILTGTGITDTDSHASVVTGDIGTSPITGAAIGLTCPQVTGIIYSVDATGPLPCREINPTLLTAAIGDMGLAYADAAGRTLPDHIDLDSGEIGGLTLAPGLYKWNMAVSISKDVTLSGGPNDIWIFQIANTLTIKSAKNVTLAGGAQAKNIFWQVAGDTVAIEPSAHFEGIILAKFKIALQTGASVKGRLLAQTATTLQANAVTQPTP